MEDRAQTPGRPKYIVCNADEGDSGTFADRMIMEGDPFVLIEGMTIAGIAVGATKGYIYIRSEYPHAFAAIIMRAIARARRGGYLGKNVRARPALRLEVRLGAGAYVCGEETSLLESLEGKRGRCAPSRRCRRIKGLFGKPTVINNVLSLATVPIILANGAKPIAISAWAARAAPCRSSSPAMSAYGGLFETAFGITLASSSNDIGGGTRAAGRCARCRSAARSAPISPRAVRHAVRLRSLRRARRPDRPWRHRGVRRHVDMAKQARFAWSSAPIESCGKCTPCRIGSTARRRDHRQDHRRRIAAEEPRAARRPLRHHEIRFALRAGRLHALPGDERAAISRRFHAAAPPRIERCATEESTAMSLIQEIDYGTPRSSGRGDMVTLTIDGQSVTVPEGTSIMRAAMEIGTEIPKLCATDSSRRSAPAGCAWSRSRAAPARRPPARRRSRAGHGGAHQTERLKKLRAA
jgi:hypothetical protein